MWGKTSQKCQQINETKVEKLWKVLYFHDMFRASKNGPGITQGSRQLRGHLWVWLFSAEEPAPGVRNCWLWGLIKLTNLLYIYICVCVRVLSISYTLCVYVCVYVSSYTNHWISWDSFYSGCFCLSFRGIPLLKMYDRWWWMDVSNTSGRTCTKLLRYSALEPWSVCYGHVASCASGCCIQDVICLHKSDVGGWVGVGDAFRLGT